mmetsp:Transcript_76746/g.121216  ORF Transcript_76746/g.121216 Transcript_76746/m.121216 type:complete len:437 (-) Transcript_76746:216-1526(-)
MGVERRIQVDDAMVPMKGDDAIVDDKIKLVSSYDKQLHMNLGLPDAITAPFLKAGGVGRRMMAVMFWMSSPITRMVFRIVRLLPWWLKHRMTGVAWKLWLTLHRKFPKSLRRGISDTLSIEAHALSNAMWWVRLFPCPVFCARFSLSQLNVNYPPTEDKNTQWIDSVHTSGLRSAYIRLTPPSETSPRVLCWVFGGAFISGDVDGNRGLAERYGRMLGCDAFLVDMRLCPESSVQDPILDLYRGYEWLLQQVPPENIIMLGISSGGGACVRMLQLAASDDATRKEYFGDRTPALPSLPQPAGAILLGPFVDYTQVTGSMEKNAAVDLVVSPGVLETILPMQAQLIGGMDKLRLCSPVYQSMKGLCPLFISVSEHECLIDEDTQLARSACAAGVDVVLSTKPYMCHVYQLLACFLPEARDEEARICEWVKARSTIWA